MIEVRQLTKSYGDRKAVDNISFTVNKGEVVGFLGPNGAGKTTTMKIITGFMAATQGSVSVAGFDVFEDPIEVKKRIGYLPETPPVYGDMRVEEFLTFVAKLKGVDSNKIRSQVDMSIQKTDLGSVRKRLIQNLSKGYRQRVGIAQALVSSPEVLILDEPTVGLDPRQVAEIRDVIKELAGHHTVVLSTHILPEVQATCQRIIIINKGIIVAEDTLEGISKRTTQASKVIVRVTTSSEALLTAIRNIPGVSRVNKDGSFIFVETPNADAVSQQIASVVISQGAGLLEIRTESANLEEVFIKLTSKEEQQGKRV